MALNRESLWKIVAYTAVLNHRTFFDAWEGTGNSKVLQQIGEEIVRLMTVTQKSFKEAVAADSEGVRLALLASENWFDGLADAQVGKEKRAAVSLFKQIKVLRCKLFGITQLEFEMSKMVAVPMHEVFELVKLRFLAVYTKGVAK